MQTVTINIYGISELSDEAKERAYTDWLNSGHDYFWGTENRDTLYKFAELTDCKIRNYEYDSYSGSVSWYFNADNDAEILMLSGRRLIAYVQNNFGAFLFPAKKYRKSYKEGAKVRKSRVLFEQYCDFTGYCMDGAICAPLYDYLKKPDLSVTLGDLLQECFDSWVKSCVSDYEYSLSMEAFIEESEANERTYTEDGKYYIA